MASKSSAGARGGGRWIAHALVHLGLARHYRLTARQAGPIWTPTTSSTTPRPTSPATGGATTTFSTRSGTDPCPASNGHWPGTSRAYPQLAYARVTQTGLPPGGPFGKAGGYEG